MLRYSVHPHGRGDNAARICDLPAPVGSPPQAWGQCGSRISAEVIRRFTPTGVGTIAYQRNAFVAAIGSPPRAWGQSDGGMFNMVWRRFTPTGVGTIASRAAAQ